MNISNSMKTPHIRLNNNKCVRVKETNIIIYYKQIEDPQNLLFVHENIHFVSVTIRGLTYCRRRIFWKRRIFLFK